MTPERENQGQTGRSSAYVCGCLLPDFFCVHCTLHNDPTRIRFLKAGEIFRQCPKYLLSCQPARRASAEVLGAAHCPIPTPYSLISRRPADGTARLGNLVDLENLFGGGTMDLVRVNNLENLTFETGAKWREIWSEVPPQTRTHNPWFVNLVRVVRTVKVCTLSTTEFSAFSPCSAGTSNVVKAASWEAVLTPPNGSFMLRTLGTHICPNHQKNDVLAQACLRMTVDKGKGQGQDKGLCQGRGKGLTCWRLARTRMIWRSPVAAR